MKKLAIFDMAGTTINDRDEVYRVLREATEREGAEYTDDQFQELMGTEKKYAIGQLLEIGGIEPTDERVEGAWEWFQEELRNTYAENPPVALPGVEEMFEALHQKDIKVALTTGFSREITDTILEGLGWQERLLVDASAAGDEVRAGRPEPYLIELAMERTGIGDKELVISAGDTQSDVVSAQRADVASVGVLTGHLTREDFVELGADFVLDSAADIVDLDILS